MASNGTSKIGFLTQVITVIAVVSTFFYANGKLQTLQSDLAAAEQTQQTLNTEIEHLQGRVTRLQHIKADIIAAIRQVVKDHLKHQTSAVLRPIQATPVSYSVPRFCWGRRITMYGTRRDDIIFGTGGPNVIWAGPGNDAVFGDGGNDRICGGSGDDTLVGDPGNDRVAGGPGNDQCVAEHTRKCES